MGLSIAKEGSGKIAQETKIRLQSFQIDLVDGTKDVLTEWGERRMASIEWNSTAQRMGVLLGDLDDLILHGQCTANLANRLGVNMADGEDFVKGSTTFTMQTRLRVSPLAAGDELARVLGRDGAIGIILGMLLEQD